ncbi:MAG: hypothetical protein WEB09_06490, partial [Nitriliruptor sp.]
AAPEPAPATQAAPEPQADHDPAGQRDPDRTMELEAVAPQELPAAGSETRRVSGPEALARPDPQPTPSPAPEPTPAPAPEAGAQRISDPDAEAGTTTGSDAEVVDPTDELPAVRAARAPEPEDDPLRTTAQLALLMDELQDRDDETS